MIFDDYIIENLFNYMDDLISWYDLIFYNIEFVAKTESIFLNIFLPLNSF
jgi:hypothetical protein